MPESRIRESCCRGTGAEAPDLCDCCHSVIGAAATLSVGHPGGVGVGLIAGWDVAGQGPGEEFAEGDVAAEGPAIRQVVSWSLIMATTTSSHQAAAPPPANSFAEQYVGMLRRACP